MSLTVHSTPRENFKFSSLPTELRLMIWNETFQQRILHITIEKIYLPDPDGRPSFLGRPHCTRHSHFHFRFKSREKPPIALQICRESRALALKHYTLSFRSTTDPPELASEVNQTALYFNPELDTVHVTAHPHTLTLGNLSFRTDNETIQSIKVLAVETLYSTMWGEHIAGNISPFKGLETLILVVSAQTMGLASIRRKMENELIQAKGRLILGGADEEWKLPVVKVMCSRAFEKSL